MYRNDNTTRVLPARENPRINLKWNYQKGGVASCQKTISVTPCPVTSPHTQQAGIAKPVERKGISNTVYSRKLEVTINLLYRQRVKKLRAQTPDIVSLDQFCGVQDLESNAMRSSNLSYTHDRTPYSADAVRLSVEHSYILRKVSYLRVVSARLVQRRLLQVRKQHRLALALCSTSGESKRRKDERKGSRGLKAEGRRPMIPTRVPTGYLPHLVDDIPANIIPHPSFNPLLTATIPPVFLFVPFLMLIYRRAGRLRLRIKTAAMQDGSGRKDWQKRWLYKNWHFANGKGCQEVRKRWVQRDLGKPARLLMSTLPGEDQLEALPDRHQEGGPPVQWFGFVTISSRHRESLRAAAFLTPGRMLGWVPNKGHGRLHPNPSPVPLLCATCTVSNDLAIRFCSEYDITSHGRRSSEDRPTATPKLVRSGTSSGLVASADPVRNGAVPPLRSLLRQVEQHMLYLAFDNLRVDTGSELTSKLITSHVLAGQIGGPPSHENSSQILMRRQSSLQASRLRRHSTDRLLCSGVKRSVGIGWQTCGPADASRLDMMRNDTVYNEMSFTVSGWQAPTLRVYVISDAQYRDPPFVLSLCLNQLKLRDVCGRPHVHTGSNNRPPLHHADPQCGPYQTPLSDGNAVSNIYDAVYLHAFRSVVHWAPGSGGGRLTGSGNTRGSSYAAVGKSCRPCNGEATYDRANFCSVTQQIRRSASTRNPPPPPSVNPPCRSFGKQHLYARYKNASSSFAAAIAAEEKRRGVGVGNNCDRHRDPSGATPNRNIDQPDGSRPPPSLSLGAHRLQKVFTRPAVTCSNAHSFVTNDTSEINVVSFDRVYDYNASVTLIWRARACAKRGWGPAKTRNNFGHPITAVAVTFYFHYGNSTPKEVLSTISMNTNKSIGSLHAYFGKSVLSSGAVEPICFCFHHRNFKNLSNGEKKREHISARETPANVPDHCAGKRRRKRRQGSTGRIAYILRGPTSPTRRKVEIESTFLGVSGPLFGRTDVTMTLLFIGYYQNFVASGKSCHGRPRLALRGDGTLEAHDSVALVAPRFSVSDERHSPWSAGTLERKEREIPENIRRPAAGSCTIPTCENPVATPPGIEPCSRSWEASSLTTAPARPRKEFKIVESGSPSRGKKARSRRDQRLKSSRANAPSPFLSPSLPREEASRVFVLDAVMDGRRVALQIAPRHLPTAWLAEGGRQGGGKRISLLPGNASAARGGERVRVGHTESLPTSACPRWSGVVAAEHFTSQILVSGTSGLMGARRYCPPVLLQTEIKTVQQEKMMTPFETLPASRSLAESPSSTSSMAEGYECVAIRACVTSAVVWGWGKCDGANEGGGIKQEAETRSRVFSLKKLPPPPPPKLQQPRAHISSSQRTDFPGPKYSVILEGPLDLNWPTLQQITHAVAGAFSFLALLQGGHLAKHPRTIDD
ncbi:hypothetical protein PR048_021191 [Dryococelus australis]|uniref:Uncharacterized protein n=1 Tax=Dryococelus australis TaxID=614101 RepID=A0ABQ9GXH4_9NEOP|nr:hypothetical protein PR048_021191 [Dryococelus australis]